MKFLVNVSLITMSVSLFGGYNHTGLWFIEGLDKNINYDGSKLTYYTYRENAFYNPKTIPNKKGVWYGFICSNKHFDEDVTLVDTVISSIGCYPVLPNIDVSNREYKDGKVWYKEIDANEISRAYQPYEFRTLDNKSCRGKINKLTHTLYINKVKQCEIEVVIAP